MLIVALQEEGLTTDNVKWPVGHHCVLCAAAAERAGLGSWCNRVIHLLKTTSGFSAGFEGLSIALVSFL